MSNFFNKSDLTRQEADKNFSNSIGATWLHIRDIKNVLPFINTLINCTSIGFGNQKNESPLSNYDLLLCLKGIEIFDIIYNPSSTKLIEDFDPKKHLASLKKKHL